MRLLRSELQRASARRLVRVSALLIGMAVVVGGIVAFVSTSSLSESVFEQRVRTVTAQQRAEQAEIERCLAHQRSTPAASAQSGGGPKGCFPSHPIESPRDPRFHASRLRDILQGSGGALAAVGRGTALTMLAAALGFSIATLGRNTAAALGAGFAYIIVFENVLGGFLERWRRWLRWLLLGNAIVFLSG